MTSAFSTAFLELLRCPSCQGSLENASSSEISCSKCKTGYPVLAGVLILVPDVEDYLLSHVKGVSRYVSDQEIPARFRKNFVRARKEIEHEHIEEDLEAERVTSLYVMTHYLTAKDVHSPSPAIQNWIDTHWDQGPFAQIKNELASLKTQEPSRKKSLVELGCGTGGLLSALQNHLDLYLGLDQSFASLVLARHLALGEKISHSICVPDDLLHGVTSKKISPELRKPGFPAEFVVCDLNSPPLKPKAWDLCASLNVIDMLPEPQNLPRLQFDLLKPQGLAIESSPYIWAADVAHDLKSKTHASNSENAIRKLYTDHGFRIEKEWEHLPWTFFKNYRQIELYSVHLIFAKKP